MKNLSDFIDTYKDYPKEGIECKDVLGIIQEPKIFKELILKMSSSQIIKNAEAIISIDARGFIFWFCDLFASLKTNDCSKKTWEAPGRTCRKELQLRIW